MSILLDQYVEQFWRLRGDAGLQDDARAAANANLAWGAVARLGNEAYFLLDALGRQHFTGLDALARAIDDTHAGASRLGGALGNAPLMLVPVVVQHADQAALPRRLGLTLPPLPDGRPIPGLVDFFLTWDELSTDFRLTAALRSTLARVRKGLSHKEAQEALARTFGTRPASAIGLGYDARDGRTFSLGFLPAYHLPDDPPWFASPAEMANWQKAAVANAERAESGAVLAHAHVPNEYLLAFAVAETLLAQPAMDRIAIAAARSDDELGVAGDRKAELLVEPFGVAVAGTAAQLRISVVPHGQAAPRHFEVVLPILNPRGWAHYQDTALRFATIAHERHGRLSRLAPFVQELDLLHPDQGTRRIHCMLGPPAASAPHAPDGLPFSFHPSLDDGNQRWYEHEIDHVREYLDLLAGTLGSQLGIEIPQRRGFSFALHDGVWRPVLIVHLDSAVGGRGKAAPWPIGNETLDAVVTRFGAAAARSWVRIVAAGAR